MLQSLRNIHKWRVQLLSLLFASLLMCSTHAQPNEGSPNISTSTALVATMLEQEVQVQGSDRASPDAGQNREHVATTHDSDDEPMIYTTPRDYKAWAQKERDRRIAEGADPDSVILQSEVANHVPCREGESGAEYGQRYSDTMNAMIRRGVKILNDQTTADVIASDFGTADGRYFDLGPGSGATKGEFREFSQWFSGQWETGQMTEVPEKWLKFERHGDGEIE